MVRASGYGAPPSLGYSTTGFGFHDLPSRKGPRPVTLGGPLHIQCNGYGDPQHLDELTTAALSWPYVDSNVPNNSSSDRIPLRLEETAAGYNFAAFISPREFGRVFMGAPTIYLALPLVCAHWAIVRGWAEPHYLCSHGLMPTWRPCGVHTQRPGRVVHLLFPFSCRVHCRLLVNQQLCGPQTSTRK
jgi:hypothetical protein